MLKRRQVLLRSLCLHKKYNTSSSSSSSSCIYLQHTLNLLQGWLAISEELMAASQSVHGQMNIAYNKNNV